jgi:inner membrane transporter RhtA
MDRKSSRSAIPQGRYALDHIGVKGREPPPQAYFVVSAVFHYLGPAFAVLLFARVDPVGVAWLRIASAGAILALWRRPWRVLRGVSAATWRLLLALGVVLAVMNSCFYVAIDRLPLGTVAAIEFLPVIVLAAIGARTARNAVALALAVPGVYLLTDVRLEGEPIGVAFAFANAGLFALYIVLAHRLSRSQEVGRIDGLATAMLVAAVAITPIGGWSAAPALFDPVAIGAGIGVGVASSVVPYVFDQLAMARLSRATYSLMVSLLPATATVIGVLVLAQIPSGIELAGVGLVVAAVALHREALPGANDDERHRGVVARDSGDDESVEELVVAEDGRHRVRAPQGVHRRTRRVQRSAADQEHRRTGSQLLHELWEGDDARPSERNA